MGAIDEPIRWGILGTAGIAENAFLPALRATGEGIALTVASRDRARAEAWANEHGVARGVEGYEHVVTDPEIEAVYIPLPNGLHAEWTIAALQAGKAVLCEKPLCGTVEDTERVLATARASTGPLWEAFVFPFHEQMDRVRQMLDDGVVGRVREIQSRFHFVLDDPEDIRLFAELAGGRSRMSAAIPSASRGCSSTPIPTSLDRSPTPSGSATAPTRSSGGRWCFRTIGGWCSRAGSSARSTRSRACSAPRARSA